MELTFVVQLGIALRVFALALIVIKVIPKQFTECLKYKNGLRLFRIFLLILGIASTFSIVAGLCFVTNRLLFDPLGVTLEFISLTYSITNLALALMLYLIYNGRDGDK